jgi:hypothetical protein
VVWGLLAALVVVIAALEYADRRGSPAPGAADPRALLGVPVEELQALEIADRGRLHRFERDPAGSWFYHGVHGAGEAVHEHTPDPALAARIARAFEALGRARLERQFPLDRDGAAYGVAHPEIVILAYRRGQTQPLAQYAVGHVAPDTVSRYVMVVGRAQVATIPSYQIDYLLELIQTASAAGTATTPTAGRRP